MNTLQIHWVKDLQVERKSFPSGDVITVTVTSGFGDSVTKVDLFVEKSFDQQLQVVTDALAGESA